MDFLHNRFSIDFAQHIIYNLLQRTDGAPFVGMGEKYFSVIDDTEIEILKCLWETPATYIRYAPPRRVWGLEIPQLGDKTIGTHNASYFNPPESYVNTFITLTLNTLKALQQLEEAKDKADTLVFNRVGRGAFFILAAQIKAWKKVYFFKGFKKAFDSIVSYMAKYSEYDQYVNKLVFLDKKDDVCDINFIEDPCICIFNESLKGSTTNIICDTRQSPEIVISYVGRVDD